jgi:molybdate transport system ATP-binding protein
VSIKVQAYKDFGSFVLDVNFEFEKDTIALLGASGSGKSMTLKAIAGIIKPDRGFISIDNHVVFDSENKINLVPQKRNVGYLFQSYALFPNMTLKQNVLCGVRKYHLRKEEQEKRFKDIVRILQLEGLEDRKPHQLSGGQQQRVALARILIGNPDILLFDEPFSALDEYLRTRLQLETKEIVRKYNIPSILVSHNRDEVYSLSEQTAIVDDGKIIVNKPTKDLFGNPEYLQASILTGCKNHDSISFEDNNIVFNDWGISIKKPKDFNESITHIGVRAHSFSPNEKENSNPIVIKEILQQPFEKLIVFRFKNQKEGSKDLYWLTDKSTETEKVSRLGFKTSKMLLLKK